MNKKIKIIKKKEIILSLLAILFLAIGFISYNPIAKNKEKTIRNEGNIGEAVLVSGNSIENTTDDENLVEETLENTEETNSKSSDFFIEAKMNRDNMYSQTLEIYEQILDNTEATSDQKMIAQNEITNISNEIKSISVAENLIKLKGFKDVVILKNKDNINVILEYDQLGPEQVAQIQNIIEREFQIDAKNITITTK